MIEKIKKMLYSGNRDDVVLAINLLGNMSNEEIQQYLKSIKNSTNIFVFSTTTISINNRVIPGFVRAFFIFKEFILSIGFGGLLYHSLDDFAMRSIREDQIIRL